jgi:hypothetical protein
MKKHNNKNKPGYEQTQTGSANQVVGVRLDGEKSTTSRPVASASKNGPGSEKSATVPKTLLNYFPKLLHSKGAQNAKQGESGSSAQPPIPEEPVQPQHKKGSNPKGLIAQKNVTIQRPPAKATNKRMPKLDKAQKPLNSWLLKGAATQVAQPLGSTQTPVGLTANLAASQAGFKHTGKTSKMLGQNKDKTSKTAKPITKSSKLTVLQLNILGLIPKAIELTKLLHEHQVDVALLQETLLNGRKITIKGYTMYHCICQGCRGGGYPNIKLTNSQPPGGTARDWQNRHPCYGTMGGREKVCLHEHL